MRRALCEAGSPAELPGVPGEHARGGLFEGAARAGPAGKRLPQAAARACAVAAPAPQRLSAGGAPRSALRGRPGPGPSLGPGPGPGPAPREGPAPPGGVGRDREGGGGEEKGAGSGRRPGCVRAGRPRQHGGPPGRAGPCQRCGALTGGPGAGPEGVRGAEGAGGEPSAGVVCVGGLSGRGGSAPGWPEAGGCRPAAAPKSGPGVKNLTYLAAAGAARRRWRRSKECWCKVLQHSWGGGGK